MKRRKKITTRLFVVITIFVVSSICLTFSYGLLDSEHNYSPPTPSSTNPIKNEDFLKRKDSVGDPSSVFAGKDSSSSNKPDPEVLSTKDKHSLEQSPQLSKPDKAATTDFSNHVNADEDSSTTAVVEPSSSEGQPESVETFSTSAQQPDSNVSTSPSHPPSESESKEATPDVPQDTASVKTADEAKAQVEGYVKVEGEEAASSPSSPLDSDNLTPTATMAEQNGAAVPVNTNTKSDQQPSPPPAPEVNETEPEIPSFREWTQKTLEEEQKRKEEEKRKKEEDRKKRQQNKQQQQQHLKGGTTAGANGGAPAGVDNNNGGAVNGGPPSLKGDPASSSKASHENPPSSFQQPEQAQPKQNEQQTIENESGNNFNSTETNSGSGNEDQNVGENVKQNSDNPPQEGGTEASVKNPEAEEQTAQVEDPATADSHPSVPPPPPQVQQPPPHPPQPIQSGPIALGDDGEKSQKLKKNFASVDCGAKVIAANPEAQHPGNIIASSRDEYMLNKCSDKIWFVIELCESIKALRIEIANFELYSSVPHAFKVAVGGAWPLRDRDWVTFGQFVAEDVRSVQTFTVQTPAEGLPGGNGVFGKYVRVEINSHHGGEHYCPISHFRVFGISEIELIGQDDEENPDDIDDELDEIGNVISNDIVETTEPSPPATVTNSEEEPSSGIVGFLRNQVERFVEVFRPKQSESFAVHWNHTSLAGNSLTFNISCNACDAEVYRDVYFLLASDYQLLRKTLGLNRSLRHALEDWLCAGYGFDFSEWDAAAPRPRRQCSGRNLMEFYRALFGVSRTIALCNVIAMERGMQPHALSMHSDLSSFYKTKPCDEASCDKGGNVVRNGNVNSGLGETQEGDKKADVSDGNVKEGTSSQHNRDSDVSNESKTDEPVKMKDPPPVVVVGPSNNGQVGVKNSASGNSGQPPQTSKETVWQKLNNKIKALEKNVSLSGGYLEELSVRYKKQIEDLQTSARQNAEQITTLNAEAAKQSSEMTELVAQLKNVTLSLGELQSQSKTVIVWAVGLHLLFILIEIVIGSLFVYLCCIQARSARSASSLPHHTALPNGGIRRSPPKTMSPQVTFREAIDDPTDTASDREIPLAVEDLNAVATQSGIVDCSTPLRPSITINRRSISPRKCIKHSNDKRRNSAEVSPVLNPNDLAVDKAIIRRKSLDFSNSARTNSRKNSKKRRSLNQQKRMMKKVASTGRIPDLEDTTSFKRDMESLGVERNVYNTVHKFEELKAGAHTEDDDSASSVTTASTGDVESRDFRDIGEIDRDVEESRFKVQQVVGINDVTLIPSKTCSVTSASAMINRIESPPPVPTSNMFEILNSSLHGNETFSFQRGKNGAGKRQVHTDATNSPVRPSSRASNGTDRISRDHRTNHESANDNQQLATISGNTNGSSTQIRSKSTSPHRPAIQEANKKKVAIFKNFDPDKADWINSNNNNAKKSMQSN